jgi:acyl-CoA thioesterase I
MLFIRRQLDRLTRQSGQSSPEGRGSGCRQSPHFSLDGRGSDCRQSRHFSLVGRGSGGRRSRHFSLFGRGSGGRQSRHFSLVATLALLVLIPWLLAAVACQRTERGAAAAAAAPPGATPAVAPRTAAPSPLPAAPSAAAPAVVFLGDSLTAGLGLPADQAYPALLARELSADGFRVRVINAGVSGDTTAGGLRRLRWLLAQHPAVVVVGLGGNDALRGQPPGEIERNLRAIVVQAKQAGAQVLLLGMQIPPNYGPDYTSAFAAIFPRVARDLEVPLVPFLLAGVGGVAELNQADGIHPTAAGQVTVAANVKPYLEQLLRQSRHAAG